VKRRRAADAHDASILDLWPFDDARLRVVRSGDSRAWGILASRFRRRVYPDRLGKRFPRGGPVNEALGMRRVGGQARPIPDVQPRRGPAGR
jgi:hypothetical protein